MSPDDPDATSTALHEIGARVHSGGDFLPGDRVATRYRIVSLLGRGGMGEVYRADDLKLGQPVALKFLPRDVDPGFLERLLGETRLARQVSHPNVCRVYDVGESGDRHFLSMEYIDGEDLASLLTRIGPLPRQKGLDVARQVCAGLDAAHQLGILHRDLKPSNVMLDGKGRARITDFGLAVAAARVRGFEAASGTPAYMAPEQLEGREATARSDLYALGVLLHELFTGHRPLHRASDELDSQIEPIVSRCLDPDPVLRPRSAREVAAALPGADPLAMAAAAGETPSPELVAASGPDKSLSANAAFVTFGAIVLSLVGLVALSDRASSLGWMPPPRTADALEDHARGMLERLGYARRPIDSARTIVVGNPEYRSYVAAHDHAPDRWKALRESGQFDALFSYRDALRYLVPLGFPGVVTGYDPGSATGDVSIGTTLRGRLVWLIAPPEMTRAPAGQSAVPWSQLFTEAGLDISRFTAVAPTRLPPVPFDTQSAWSGMLPDFGNIPVRVHVATLAGRPVFFELVVPWDAYWDVSGATDPPSRTTRFYAVALGTVCAIVLGLTLVLALRNWLSGRGDRRGALRLAVVVLTLRLVVWLTGAHHVPVFREEWFLFLTGLGKSLVDAAAAWCLYVALEPHARRVQPRLLVSWTRLLHGRVRDPLVGRDVLAGVACSMVVILCWGQLYVLLPHALGVASPPPPVPFPLGSLPYLRLFDGPLPQTVLGGRHVIEGIALQALGVFVFTLLTAMVLLVALMLLKRGALAMLATGLLISIVAWPAPLSHYSAIGVACALAGGAAVVWATRFGLVGLAALWFALNLWMNFPVTAAVVSPFFATGLVAVLLIAALALYGAVVSSVVGGRS
jgi:serine/threonine protein kinase